MIKALASDIEVITLFVEDLPATKAFYTDVFGLDVVHQDDLSAVLELGATLINLLKASEAPELVEPIPVGADGQGARALLTIKVDDTDTVVEQLRQHGVTVLNGPIDRPWGRRTAAFADPAGNVWEAAQDIADV